MNRAMINAGLPIDPDWIDLADRVVLARPNALRDYDQIYMMSGAMILQTILMHDYIAGRDIVFIGDGDGMSMMFGLFAREKIIPCPRKLIVLDMDKRTLAAIKKFADNEKFSHMIELIPYNVFNPIPTELAFQADMFYTNPPYGSKNHGRSGICFLSRCMELSKRTGSIGVAVLPYETTQPWSITAMWNIQKFLLDHGYSISEMITGLHKYHLPDNPVLASGYILAKRIKYEPHGWENKEMPAEYLNNFYGESVNKLPCYVEQDGTINYWVKGS